MGIGDGRMKTHIDDIQYLYCAINNQTGELFSSRKSHTTFFMRLGQLRLFMADAEKYYKNFWKRYWTIHSLTVTATETVEG
jgi:hypothetical protein